MAEALGIAASVVEIVRLATAITQFISEISDDASGIRNTLDHFENTIDGVRDVFENIKDVVEKPGSCKSDNLVRIISNSAKHCKGLLEGLKDTLPKLAKEAGIGRKAKAALDKKLNEKVIQEQLNFLDQYMRIAQLALSAIESRQIQEILTKIDRLETYLEEIHALPPYSPDNTTDFNLLRCNIENFRDITMEEKTLHDPDARSVAARREENRPSPQGLHPVLEDLFEDVPAPILSEHDTMEALEAKGMFFKAAKAGRSNEEGPELKEKRANLFLKCSTVRSYLEALDIVEQLWKIESSKGEDTICPKRLGEIGCKLARLYLDNHRLGHFNKSQRAEDRAKASDVLCTSLGVLTSNPPALRPFPYDIVWMVGSLQISIFKEDGEESHALHLEKALPQRLEKKLVGEAVQVPSDWPRRFEPSISRALTWCEPENITKLLRDWPATAIVARPANLRFDIRSPDFRFDEAVGDISPLQLAVIFGEKDIVREMLREVEEVDVGPPPLITPLLETSRNGRGDIAQMLLERGASVERVDSKQRTALHLAQTAEALDAVGVAKLFLDAKPDPLLEVKDADDKTALYLACEAGDEAMVKLLVNNRYKVDINVTDPYGKTALHATVDAKDRLGERLNIAEILLKAGAYPNTSDSRDHTPLCTASSLGHVGLVELLLEHKADPNRPGEEGETPLIAATRRNHAAVVRELRMNNADPYKKDADGLHALHYARHCRATLGIDGMLRSDPASLRRRPSHVSAWSEPPPRRETTNTVTTPSQQGTRRSTVPASEQPDKLLRTLSFWRSKNRKKP